MKPKAEIMARTRKARKDAGLVELRLWLTPEQREAVRAYASTLSDDPFIIYLQQRAQK